MARVHAGWAIVTGLALTWCASARAADCAQSLPSDARMIYDATLPSMAPGVDLQDVVTSHTKALVMAGKLDRGHARSAAQQAATCLRQHR